MITEGFVANGAKVYICSRKKEAIQATADALTKRGTNHKRDTGLTGGPGVCIAIQADLSTYEGCVGLAKELESREKCTRPFWVPGLTVDLDVLVHNSGNNWGAPFEEYVRFTLWVINFIA